MSEDIYHLVRYTPYEGASSYCFFRGLPSRKQLERVLGNGRTPVVDALMERGMYIGYTEYHLEPIDIIDGEG